MELAGSFKTAPTGARIELDHNSNSIIIYDANNVARQNIAASPIRDLASYTTANSNEITATCNIAANSNNNPAPATVYSAVLTLPPTSNNYTVTTPQISVSASASSTGDLPGTGGPASATTSAYLITPTGAEIYLGGVSTSASNGGSQGYSTVVPSKSFSNMPAGNYKIMLTASAGGDTAGSSATIASPNNVLRGVSSVNTSYIHHDGMLLMADATHYDYMSPAAHQVRRGDTIFKVSDSGVEGAGVLYAGVCPPSCIIANKWGTKKSDGDASKNGVGKFRVPHNIGHSNYTTTANAIIFNCIVSVVAQTNNYVDIEISRNGAYYDSGFNFQIVGANN